MLHVKVCGSQDFSTLAFGMYDGLDDVHHRVTLSRSHFLLAGPLNPTPYRWILVVYCSLPGPGLRSGCRRCVPRYVAAGRGASNNTMAGLVYLSTSKNPPFQQDYGASTVLRIYSKDQTADLSALKICT